MVVVSKRFNIHSLSRKPYFKQSAKLKGLFEKFEQVKNRSKLALRISELAPLVIMEHEGLKELKVPFKHYCLELV
jgi:hypothetical protein